MNGFVSGKHIIKASPTHLYIFIIYIHLDLLDRIVLCLSVFNPTFAWPANGYSNRWEPKRRSCTIIPAD